MGKITHFISELNMFFKEKTENSAFSSILAVQKCINVSDNVIGLSKKDNYMMTSFQVLTLLLLFPLFGIAGVSHFLLTTDMGMDLLKAYRTYQMRWTTEVAYRIWQILLSVIFAIADRFSIYFPESLTLIINVDNDIQTLMNLNVKWSVTG